MKCPKCNSENVQAQSKEYKPKFTVPIIMVCGGFGLMFFGIGAIVGVIVGAIIAAIVNSAIPQTYHSVMVCQDCGHVSQPFKQPMNQVNTETRSHPLLCTMDECNLVISRTSSSTGALCSIEVTIDGVAPFEIKDGETKYLKVEQGEHQVTYQQVNGMGKDLRKGSVNISISESKHMICLKMLPKGLDVFVK